jgi:hypothetical protein
MLEIGTYKISPELFEQGYPQGSGPCACTSACCEEGVYLDPCDRDRILKHHEIIKASMDETQSTDEKVWFDQQEEEDSDFPSGKSVATNVVNGKCAFLDRTGRCSIQVASVAAGMDRWALKPFFCILYPIDVSDGVVSFDALLQDEQTCCSVGARFETPLFEACKGELTFLVGENGYAEIERYYRTTYMNVLETRERK